MDWSKVAAHLIDEGFKLRERAETAHPDDPNPRRRMIVRGELLIALGDALRAGLPEDAR